MASLVVGCEMAFYMINRLKAYMDFLSKLPLIQARINFEEALKEMHVHVLTFLARAIETYQRPTFQRAFTAFWQASDVQDFEQECDKLGARLDIEANNCNRAVAEQDRGVLGQLLQELQQVLKEIEQVHTIQATLARLEKKMDLGRLRVVEGATFDAYSQVHRGCHPATRVDLLGAIYTGLNNRMARVSSGSTAWPARASRPFPGALPDG